MSENEPKQRCLNRLNIKPALQLDLAPKLVNQGRPGDRQSSVGAIQVALRASTALDVQQAKVVMDTDPNE